MSKKGKKGNKTPQENVSQENAVNLQQEALTAEDNRRLAEMEKQLEELLKPQTEPKNLVLGESQLVKNAPVKKAPQEELADSRPVQEKQTPRNRANKLGEVVKKSQEVEVEAEGYFDRATQVKNKFKRGNSPVPENESPAVDKNKPEYQSGVFYDLADEHNALVPEVLKKEARDNGKVGAKIETSSPRPEGQGNTGRLLYSRDKPDKVLTEGQFAKEILIPEIKKYIDDHNGVIEKEGIKKLFEDLINRAPEGLITPEKRDEYIKDKVEPIVTVEQEVAQAEKWYQKNPFKSSKSVPTPKEAVIVKPHFDKTSELDKKVKKVMDSLESNKNPEFSKKEKCLEAVLKGASEMCKFVGLGSAAKACRMEMPSFKAKVGPVQEAVMDIVQNLKREQSEPKPPSSPVPPVPKGHVR